MKFKNPKYQRPKKWKNLKQLLTSQPPSNPNTPTFLNIDAPPSILPKQKYCDLTGLPAKYTDPKSGLYYRSKEEYFYISEMNGVVVQQLLSSCSIKMQCLWKCQENNESILQKSNRKQIVLENELYIRGKTAISVYYQRIMRLLKPESVPPKRLKKSFRLVPDRNTTVDLYATGRNIEKLLKLVELVEKECQVLKIETFTQETCDRLIYIEEGQERVKYLKRPHSGLHIQLKLKK